MLKNKGHRSIKKKLLVDISLGLQNRTLPTVVKGDVDKFDYIVIYNFYPKKENQATQLNKSNNPKDLNRHFSKYDMQMANMHWKDAQHQ